MLNMADDLQGGSEITGFQEDSLTKGGNKRNTKLFANMKIFLVFSLMIKEIHGQRTNQRVVNMKLMNNEQPSHFVICVLQVLWYLVIS